MTTTKTLTRPSATPLFLHGAKGKDLAIKTGVRAGASEANKKGG